MTITRGKKKVTTSNKTEENEAAENDFSETLTSLSVTVNVEEEHKVDAPLKDKVDITVDEAMKGSSEGMSGGEQCEKVTKLDIDDKKMLAAEKDGDDKADLEENTFEDDEIYDQEDTVWGDDEENADHDNEERVVDEYDFSDEEATDEDDEDDEGSEEDAMEEDDDEAEVSEEEDSPEEREVANQGEIEAKAKEDGRKAEEHNTTEFEESLKIVKKSSEKSKNKKVQADRSKKVDPVDKPESSRKKKAKKRVESMGMIFMCSSVTKKDCFQYRVFGLPEGKKADVEKIYTGMRLFLYDVDLKLMYGIYKAAGPGGYNIQPKAFKSQFPSQVRYKVLENCLPLAEEKFKNIIKGNYYTKTKFDCKLNSEQVKKLCKLFVASNKGRRSKKMGKSLKAEKPPVRRERMRRKRTGGERHLPLRDVEQKHERPRKRPRNAISPAPPLHQRPAPLPSTLPSAYVYERTSAVDAYRRDPYSERRDSYRDRRDPLLSRRPYNDRRDPPVERNDRYRDGRDPPVERNDRYRDGRDPPIERNDRYRDGRDPPIERNDRYRDERDSYLDSYYVYRDAPGPYVERRDPYKVDRDPYLRRRDPYRDGRDPYLEVLPDLYKDRQDPNIERLDGRDPYLEIRLPYREATRPELYSSYRRDLLTDGSDAYRGVEYRSSYRREEPLETRRHDIASRDSYLLTRERPSYAEPAYTAEYPSRTGLYRL
ncbi:hypothetical protein ACS0TY_008169 [Phlomoides rotata]